MLVNLSWSTQSENLCADFEHVDETAKLATACGCERSGSDSRHGCSVADIPLRTKCAQPISPSERCTKEKGTDEAGASRAPIRGSHLREDLIAF